MSNDGLTISFPANDSTEQRRTKVAAMAEGAVQVNMAEIQDGATIDVDSLVYENPRGSRNQRIGSLGDVARRKRATCLEICCIVVAADRLDGVNSFVQVLATKFKEKVRPFTYHAVVRRPDGSVYDASELLRGYNTTGELWQRTGHCCPSCMIDAPCQGDCSCGGKH
jgi:hypothetical protein